MSDTYRMSIDIDALIGRAGGIGKLAAVLGVSNPTVYDWKKSGFIPGRRVAQISHALDIPLEDISKLIKPPTTQQSASMAAE